MSNTNYRTESDFLGEIQIPVNALYGIHSLRASENFPDNTPFHIEWYKTLGTVKKACYYVASDFFKKAKEKLGNKTIGIKFIAPEITDLLLAAASEIENGKHFNSFIVPAISGGAGTSINLNINEIITNRALNLHGKKCGDYKLIDPFEHANIFQSTNDVIPSSLKITIIKLLEILEESINNLRQLIEILEKEHSMHLRRAYTQMQEAVPTSFGRLFSTYNDALSRDWWRISKCFERIKVINLGGSAIGSAITVPRYFVMEITKKLQQLTNLPITRSENLYDATNNTDSFVEVHGILKAHAVNLEKMVSDIRLLSSDILKEKEIEIPQKQVGSSIMPGKVNPVIPEFVISSVHKIYSNDSLISTLSAQGCLELNAYLPIIGHAILESIKLLTACNRTIKNNLINGLVIKNSDSEKSLFSSPAITTALIPYIGYNKASALAMYMKENNTSIQLANKHLKLIEIGKLDKIIDPVSLLSEGFTLNDLTE